MGRRQTTSSGARGSPGVSICRFYSVPRESWPHHVSEVRKKTESGRVISKSWKVCYNLAALVTSPTRAYNELYGVTTGYNGLQRVTGYFWRPEL